MFYLHMVIICHWLVKLVSKDFREDNADAWTVFQKAVVAHYSFIIVVDNYTLDETERTLQWGH